MLSAIFTQRPAEPSVCRAINHAERKKNNNNQSRMKRSARAQKNCSTNSVAKWTKKRRRWTARVDLPLTVRAWYGRFVESETRFLHFSFILFGIRKILIIQLTAPPNIFALTLFFKKNIFHFLLKKIRLESKRPICIFHSFPVATPKLIIHQNNSFNNFLNFRSSHVTTANR